MSKPLTPTVAIFRKRLLSYSETFIADQGKLLPTYRPIYCGYQKDDSGAHLLDGSTRILLEEHSGMAALSKFLFRRGLGGGKAWIRAIRGQSPRLLHAHFLNDGLDAVKLAHSLGLPAITRYTDMTSPSMTMRSRKPASTDAFLRR